jgi:tRNA pseudouridine55 synthase
MSRPRRVTRRVNGIILLDKPLGLSSNAALMQVRHLFAAEKAGHTGSLDPLATGLLPICLGQATKLCGRLLDADKRYQATVHVGVRTATGDREGEVLERSDPQTVTEPLLRAVLARFVGEQAQIPPMYSALKQDGVRLYQLAREGQVVERPARQIQIHGIELLDFSPQRWVLDIRCSKGTYIRVLAEDIAAALGQKAHLEALRRVAAGPFQGPMWTLEQLAALAAQGPEHLDEVLLPASAALAGWPRLAVDPVRAHRLARGQAVPVAGAPRAPEAAVFDEQGELLCLAAVDAQAVVRSLRWLRD